MRSEFRPRYQRARLWVVAIIDVGTSRRIRLRGDALRTAELGASVRVLDGAVPSTAYMFDRFDRRTGTLEIEVDLSDGRRGSRWACLITSGEQIEASLERVAA